MGRKLLTGVVGEADLGSQVCKTSASVRGESFAHSHQPTQVFFFTFSATHRGDKNSSDSQSG